VNTAVVSPQPTAHATARQPVTWKHEAEKVAEALVLFGGYLVIGRGEAALHIAGHTLEIPIDRTLPFSATWVFAYTTFWLFAFAPLLYTRYPPYFRRVFAAMVATMVVTYAIFIVFPTANVLRPSLDGTVGFASWLVRQIYAGDAPDNCFPSLHVALSCVAAWSLGEVDPRVRIGAWVLAVLIIVSTVLLKQHYVVDVAGGVLLGFVAHRLTLGRYVRRDPPEEDDRRSRWVLGVLAALQAAGLLGAFVWYRAS
jgi:membrane-associated phospholipid phosphatase